MSKKVLAITTCRVSSVEQLESNSLNRQQRAVIMAAKELLAVIPEDGQWSGSISSKAGTNIYRRDLQEMLEYCRKNKAVKYLIVDEVDRFMRSVKELFYFEVEFEKLGVKVWYATQPELNNDDHTAKLLKAIEVFKAEGTNVERQTKSIKGQTDALKVGRYPFCPKPGYKRGYERGIPEIHEDRGPALKAVLERVAARLVTPSEGLAELNSSSFTVGHSTYKMDKFRKIVTDPFYAGIVEVDKQVKVRNEKGLHTPLISKYQHQELLKIMDAKKKNQTGPRKNGNPKYPMNNIVMCDLCIDKPNGRVVGFDHGNGHSKGLIYEKYRCRACNRYITRQELHAQVKQQFVDNPISPEGLEILMQALETVWKQRQGENGQEANRLKYKINRLNESISQQVEAATDPTHASIKQDILTAITRKKEKVIELEDRLEKLKDEADSDKKEFLRFAFNFIENMGSRFLEISQENRLRCKQVVFPAGFSLNAHKKVYTTEISPLIRLAGMKKDAKASNISRVVRVRGL